MGSESSKVAWPVPSPPPRRARPVPRTAPRPAPPTPMRQRQLEAPPQPPPVVQASELATAYAGGKTVDVAFTPGLGHIVATVEVDTPSGVEDREIRIFDLRPGALQDVPVYFDRQLEDHLVRQDLTQLTPDPRVYGTFVLHPLRGEGFFRPVFSSSMTSPVIDWVQPASHPSCRWRGTTRLSAPMAASPRPELMPGFHTILAGVDHERRNVLRIVGMSRDGGRLDKTFATHRAEITHVAFTGDGECVATLSKDKCCRLTSLVVGTTTLCAWIDTPHSPCMLKCFYVWDGPQGQRTLVVASTWGSDVAIWWPSGGATSACNPYVFDLNDVLGRAVLPLCITDCGTFLACGTHDGFDIIDLFTGRPVAMRLGAGLYDIKTGAFSSGDSRYLVVGTTERIHVYHLAWPWRMP